MGKKKRSEASSPVSAADSLSKALKSYDADAVKAALIAGADPDHQVAMHSSPLNMVLALRSPLLKKRNQEKLSAERQLAVMQVLLEAGANPNLSNCEPTILMAITSSGLDDEQIVLRQLQLLLDFGAHPNALGRRPPSFRSTALHLAASRRWLSVGQLLLSRGADLGAVNGFGLTPLQSVVKRCNEVKRSYDKSTARQLPQDTSLGVWGTVLAGIKKTQEEKDQSLLNDLQKMIDFLKTVEARTI